MSMRAKSKNKLSFKYTFSNSKKHPYDEVNWDEYGLAKGLKLRKLINQVVQKYSETGWALDYFNTLNDKKVFEHELIWLLINQVVIPENRVLFTVGKETRQRVSSNTIIGVENSTSSKLDCVENVIRILESDNNVGVNLSKISSSKENHSTVGVVEFLKMINKITSNFSNKKSFTLDIDHPDIIDFIKSSYDFIDGSTYFCVRVSDDFMKAVKQDSDFILRSRKTGKSIETKKAKSLFNEIILATANSNNFCLQFDNTINTWQTLPTHGKILASNPSGDFLTNDFLECPRVILNLEYFLDGQKFDFEKYKSAIEITLTMLDISINFADFSTTYIDNQTKKNRPIGIGFTNFEDVLKHFKISLNSKAAQVIGSAIANFTTAATYHHSSQLANVINISNSQRNNLLNQISIAEKYYKNSLELTDKVVDEMKPSFNINEILFASNLEWDRAISLGKKSGFRNCQMTLLPLPDDFIFEKEKNRKKIAPIDQIKLFSSIQSFITGGIGLPIITKEKSNLELIEKLYFSAWKNGLKSIFIKSQ